MDSSWALLGAALASMVAAVPLLLLLLLSISKRLTSTANNKLPPSTRPPPGPKPWPFIGNLNLLAGSIPHHSLHLLSRKYGEIMLLKFGKFPVVVASSPHMAKQFLKVHDAVFASRPALAAGKYTSYNYSNMAWAPYGPFWRQARKIYLSEVFNPRTLDSFEHIRTQERHNFISRLYSLSHTPIVLREHLLSYTLSTITRMVLGDKYLMTESSVATLKDLQEMSDEWFFLNGVLNIGDWIPVLSFLDLQGYVKRMKALRKKWDRFHNYVIGDRIKARARAKAEKNDDFIPEPKNVVDVLLQMTEDPNLEVKLTEDCIKGLLMDLLDGGTDTSATAIEWAILEIMRQPRIIAKAKEELDRVIGRERWVEENDSSQLPYIDAIVMETMRLHPLATLLAPHYAMEDCNVEGYDISKGTTVLINTWSIGRDPNTWGDAPEEFLPERFVGKEIDIVLGTNFALLPFGSGRRRCPGYNLGMKIVRAAVANLIHGFDMKLGEGVRPQDISIEEAYGLTTHPKCPPAIIMEPALPPHLY